MIQFVRDATTSAEAINEHDPVPVTKDRERTSGILHPSQGQQRMRTLGLTTSLLNTSEQDRSCPACLQGLHSLTKCQQFLAMSNEQHLSFVKKKRLLLVFQPESQAL